MEYAFTFHITQPLNPFVLTYLLCLILRTVSFIGMYVCMSYRVPPLTYRRTLSSHKDRKGSFTTRPTGKVPGYKNVIKRAYYLQQPACWHNTTKAVVACLCGGENQIGAWRKPPQACTEQTNRVDITKHN